jgi:hypothetical protein
VDAFKHDISPEVAAAATKLQEQYAIPSLPQHYHMQNLINARNMYNSTRERIEKDIAALRQAWTSLAAIDPRPAPPGRHPSANSAGSDI